MHRRSLPIAEPCHEDFDAMQPHGSRRYCDSCCKSVHDLSSMTKAQAHDFLRQHQGQQICVRYQTAPDGTLRFAPPPPVRPAAVLRLPVVAAMAGMMAACTGYVDAMDLEVPDESTCVDEAGYSIPCDEVQDVIPVDVEDPTEPDPEGEDVVDVPVLDDDSYVIGGITVEDLPPPELPKLDVPTSLGRTTVTVVPKGESSEGCPLERWDEADGGDYETMGDVEVPRYSRREARQIRREARRERRARARSRS